MVHQLDLVRAEPIELLPQSVCSGKRGAAASDGGQRQIQSESLPKKERNRRKERGQKETVAARQVNKATEQAESIRRSVSRLLAHFCSSFYDLYGIISKSQFAATCCCYDGCKIPDSIIRRSVNIQEMHLTGSCGQMRPSAVVLSVRIQGQSNRS